jgi:hypothetical protein
MREAGTGKREQGSGKREQGSGNREQGTFTAYKAKREKGWRRILTMLLHHRNVERNNRRTNLLR